MAFYLTAGTTEIECKASGSQITPTAEFEQGAQRRSPAGVLIAERLLRSNPAIGLAILGFAKHLLGGFLFNRRNDRN